MILTITLDHLLTPYYSPQFWIERMRRPWQYGSHVYASQGFALIRIPQSRLEGRFYPAYEKNRIGSHPDKFWPSLSRKRSPYEEINMIRLGYALEQVQEIPNHEYCPVCVGTGLTFGYSCEHCSGSGIINLTEKAQSQALYDYPCLMFEGIPVRPATAQLLYNTWQAMCTDEPVMWLTRPDQEQALWFQIGPDVDVLLMPVWQEHDKPFIIVPGPTPVSETPSAAPPHTGPEQSAPAIAPPAPPPA